MGYRFFRLGCWLFPRLPEWLVRLLPGLVGPLVWALAGRVRRQAMRNICQVLGPDACAKGAGRRRLQRVVRGLFRTSVANYLSAFTLPTRDHQTILGQVTVTGLEHLTEAL